MNSIKNPTPFDHKKHKTSWIKSKWSLAAHMAIAYIGISAYIQYMVRYKYIPERDGSLPKKNLESRGDESNNNAINSKQDQKSPKYEIEDIKSATSFDEIAAEYDKKLGMDELVIGMNLMRRMIMRHAKGDVLELSVGTGRNLPYYPVAGKIKSATFIDSSYSMLKQTIKKFDENVERFKFKKPWYIKLKESVFNDVNDRAPVQDGEEIPTSFIHCNQGILDFPENSFDTVIDTFGLCSVGKYLTDYREDESKLIPQSPHDMVPPEKAREKSDGISDDPVLVLNEMARVCKPDGYILLLEHGLASYDWLNKLLDRDALKHFQKWSCWWNRDITRIIEKSNLEIISIWRWHLGTTYYIIAKPKKNFFKGHS